MNFKFIIITVSFAFLVLVKIALGAYTPCQSGQYCCLACENIPNYAAGACAYSSPSSDSSSYRSLTGSNCNDVNDPDCCSWGATCWCCRDECLYTGQKECTSDKSGWKVCGNYDNDRCYDWQYNPCNSNEYCLPDNPMCYQKVPNGYGCYYGSYQCLSGNCNNGVCCDSSCQTPSCKCCRYASDCGASSYYCQGTALHKKYQTCSNYICGTGDKIIATCTGSDYVCSGNSKVRRDYYCQNGAPSCQYKETVVENCDTNDGCLGSNYLDYYCSGGSCVYNTKNPDTSQRACETCAGGKWLGPGAPENCCNNNDTFCFGKGSCVNGVFHDNHCGDKICDCGESISSCFADCCQKNGEQCEDNNKCCSGHCKADYNGNRFCCEANQCAYNGTCYNNGERSGLYVCFNGGWKGGPVTTISPNGTNGSWIRIDMPFNLSCKAYEGLSCSETKYKIINSSDDCPSSGFTRGTSATVSCPINSKCEKAVCYFSVDNLNTYENVKKSGTFLIDREATRPPITEIKYKLRSSNKDIPFNLTCIPNEIGCKKTYYKIINSNENCGDGRFSIGNHSTISCESFCRKKICFYSEDMGGNKEEIRESAEFVIDKLPPTCSLNSPDIYQNKYLSPNFTLSWEAQDMGSGLYETFILFSFNRNISTDQWVKPESFCTSYSNSTECNGENGKTYNFICKARDWVGNIGTSDILTLTVDGISPVANFYRFENISNSFIIMWTGQDNVGVRNFDIEVKINGSWRNITTVCKDINTTCQGKACLGSANCTVNVKSYLWRIRAYDDVGNVGDWIYSSNMACNDKDGDGYCTEQGDCNDADPTVYPGAKEICDGKDNDCDGEIDEDFKEMGVGEPCGVGACKGIYVCNKNGTGVICRVDNNVTKRVEICNNNLDDDCDGIIDEEFEEKNGKLVPACICINGDERICGSNVGECKAGRQVCIDGVWGPCEGNIKPKQEICNDGKDNDCDGKVDEDYEIVNGKKVIGCICVDGDKRPCGSNIGECKTGTQICVNGTWSRCKDNIGPKEEICNDGKDNDCDGKVDESDCIKSECFNGIQDPGEEGIDCGKICNKKCVMSNTQVNILFMGVATVIIISMVGGIYLVLK